MPREAREITANDIMPMTAYAGERKRLRQENVALKRARRLSVGPHVTVFFENFDTMLMQVQEMLYIERGGDDQLADELEAYNPMIPNGRELTATLMFEIDDPVMRKRILSQLAHVERNISIMIGDERVAAVSEEDVERTTADGKTSSVHFLHFPFSDAAIAAFRDPSISATFVIDHPSYGHMAMIAGDIRASLIADFS